MTVLLWLLCGALFSFGIIGFLTGLLLLPFAVALLVHLRRRQMPGSWASLIGAGVAALTLFWGDVVGHPAANCVSNDHETACRASASVPGFFVGIAVIGIGILLGIASERSTLASPRDSSRGFGHAKDR